MENTHKKFAIFKLFKHIETLFKIQQRNFSVKPKIKQQIKRFPKRFWEKPDTLVDRFIDTVKYKRFPYNKQRIVWEDGCCIGGEYLLLFTVDRSNFPLTLQNRTDMTKGKGTPERNKYLHDLSFAKSDILGNDRYIGQMVIEMRRYQFIYIQYSDVFVIFPNLSIIPRIDQHNTDLVIDKPNIFQDIVCIFMCLNDNKYLHKHCFRHNMPDPGITGRIRFD